jgi:hypothetical protein
MPVNITARILRVKQEENTVYIQETKSHFSEVTVSAREPKCCMCPRGLGRKGALLKTYISACHRGQNMFYAFFMREALLHVSP